jgi:hypothetical protein
VPAAPDLLGPNKTFMAFPAAVFGAVVVTFVQSRLPYGFYNYREDWLLLGLCFGTGAVYGDWFKSYVKRMLGMQPGARWWFEKIDFLVMSFFFITAFLQQVFPVEVYLVPVVFMFLVHGPGNYFAYRWRLRNLPH